VTRRAAVVGAGTAGAATATLLARQGWAVTVLEQVPDPRPVGAGIVLQPTGMQVLARLGILGRVVDRGAPLEALRCVTSTGRTVVRLPYAHVAPGLYGLGIHRGALFEALLDVLSDADAELRCGIAVRSIDEGPDGATLRDEAGDAHGRFDVVVVADGARSRLRHAVGAVRREREYPWGALWLVARDPDRVYRDELFQVVRGTRRFMGLLPTGLGPGAGDQPCVSLFWSVRCDAVDDFRRAPFARFRDEVLGYDPRAEGVMDQIRSAEELLFARYHDVVLSRFHHGRVVCIGDAAHSTSPQLGQGSNLALCDAATLADCLAERDDVPEALALYERRRRRHLAFYQFATRWLTPFFQSDHRWLGPVRDVLFPLGCAIPLVRDQMIRTMCGVKRGLVRRSLPLEPLRAALPPPPQREPIDGSPG